VKLSRLKAPNTFVLLFSFLVAVAAMTWIVPGGAYERAEADGREIVVPGSFQRVPAEPQGLGALLMAPIRGFAAAAPIIGFVLLVGGAFGVLSKSGAIEAALRSLVHASGRVGRAFRRWWIPVFTTLFSLGGAIFGMSEEVIPFVLIFVPLSVALGGDSLLGVAVPLAGSQAGFAGAFLNPFNIGVAQGIADLPLFSGMGYRILVWCVSTAIAIAFLEWYARRIRKHPARSPVHALDRERARRVDPPESGSHARMDRRHRAVLTAFMAGMAALVLGVLTYGWYIEEIAGLFVGVALVTGPVGGLNARETAEAFAAGAKELTATALVIALARGVLVLAQDGRIIDTILHSLSAPLAAFPPAVAAQAMFGAQWIINFFVPSGSGQAALTMPIMAPLSDLVAVPRQVAVLAFQLGDGWCNLIIPTSAVTMGCLTLAKIEYGTWARWIAPLILGFLAAGLVLVAAPFTFGWR